MKNSRRKISVITVCRNCADLLRETVVSVLDQDYEDIEYLIVDGKSTDSSVKIAKEFAEKVQVVSEKDSGIYDAMNKGIHLASGEYIFFLNAGDRFWSKSSLSFLAEKGLRVSADLIYGDVMFGNVFKSGNVKHRIQLVFRTICHQGILSSRDYLRENPFDVTYRWLADYEWLIRAFSNKTVRRCYVNEIIAYYDPENRTELNRNDLKQQRLRERRRIGEEYFRGFEKLLFKLNQNRLERKFSSDPIKAF